MNDYELLDFGDGCRLERFGSLVIDRPCPAAETFRRRNPERWSRADVRFIADPVKNPKSPDRGRWMPMTEHGKEFFTENETKPWIVRFGAVTLELRGTPFGHLGVFPEQQSNWRTIADRISQAASVRSETVRVLNLFAYTGGSSIAAALAAPTVEVVHVDSAKSVVDGARKNAMHSGVGTSENFGRIRFIVEDARKFVRRELRRGNRYDAVILDPPSYGHGQKGEVWKLAEDLPPLLADLAALMSAEPLFVLLTAHTPGFDAEKLCQTLRVAGFSSVRPLSLNIDALPAGHGALATKQKPKWSVVPDQT